LRILVLGGTRFIGPFVVRRLAARGHEVVVFHRGQTHAELPEGVERILGERASIPDRVRQFAELAVDVVIDMIPMGAEDARNVVWTFRGIARRLVALSSIDVYRGYERLLRLAPGPPEPVPFAETSPLRTVMFPLKGRVPRGDAYDKILVERMALGDPGLPGTVLRLPMVHGPGDRQHRLWPYLKRMDDGRPRILVETSVAAWRTSRDYVENVAEAVALAATDDRAARRVFNVGEAAPLSTAGWIEAIGREAGWAGRVAVVPKERMPKPLVEEEDFAQDLVADTGRIRAELGYVEPVSREEGLRRTMAWERANPPEKVDPAAFDYAAEDDIK
jgi:nucleoside-diphosphate-sugar epimerase